MANSKAFLNGVNTACQDYGITKEALFDKKEFETLFDKKKYEARKNDLRVALTTLLEERENPTTWLEKLHIKKPKRKYERWLDTIDRYI